MTKTYACTLCKKVFNQKSDYDKHANKKAPCITLEEIEKMQKEKEVKTDMKSILINTFKSCLNVLRDNEGLTGDKALRNMSYLLTLKLIEPHFGKEIDIDGYPYDFSHIEDDIAPAHKTRLLKLVRFSKLAQEKEDNIPITIKYLWDDILSIHPATKSVFLKDQKFDIRNQSIFKILINKINALDLSKTEHDVLGDAYEEIIKDIMKGKILGQFFTPPLVKKMMIKLIDPQIHLDGKIETCGDPTMGTGGFLITYLQYILQQASIKNIKPDWDFIKNEGLYGKEIEPDTFQLAVSNMLISSGHIFEKLDRGDSIREPITRKFDNILANPPFGIKGLKYDDFRSGIKNEYVPINSDNAVSLFIQVIIYLLKINGKCAVVLPEGKDLFSKTDNTLVLIREYLMKTCDLKEIIYLPSGIFTNTPIKTCVFYFVKKRDVKDVLLEVNNDKKKYKLTRTHQTTKVQFYDYDPYKDIKNLLVEVPIEKIANNSYSLNYTEYIDEIEQQYGSSIIVKTLGEICEFLPKSKRHASHGEKEGLYPFYTSSSICNKYCDEADYDEECLIIGTGGNANIKHAIKFSCSADNFIIKVKYGQLTKFVYYYLLFNVELLQNGFVGSGLQHISKDYITNIKIPILLIEHQKELVKHLDYIYETTIKSSNAKIAELKYLNNHAFVLQKMANGNIIKTLGEVCEINYGTRIVKNKVETGEYPVYGSGRAMFYTNTFNREGFNILIGRFALSPDCVRFTNEKLFLNDSGLSVDSKNKLLINKYLGYYLIYNQNIIYKCARGPAQKNLDMEDFKTIKIPIPLIEYQNEIVKYCDFNENLIKHLEQEIENNKNQAKKYMEMFIREELVPIEKSEVESEKPTSEQDEKIQEFEMIEHDTILKMRSLTPEKKAKSTMKTLPVKKRISYDSDDEE